MKKIKCEQCKEITDSYEKIKNGFFLCANCISDFCVLCDDCEEFIYTNYIADYFLYFHHQEKDFCSDCTKEKTVESLIFPLEHGIYFSKNQVSVFSIYGFQDPLPGSWEEISIDEIPENILADVVLTAEADTGEKEEVQRAFSKVVEKTEEQEYIFLMKNWN